MSPPSLHPTEIAVHNTVATFRSELILVARRRGGSRIDADEIVQSAIARALERSGQLRDVAQVEAWLGRIVRNAVFDALRLRAKATVPLAQVAEPAAEQPASTCDCAVAQAQQLKPEYAAILREVVMNERSVTEVANELGVTANSAMVRLHRARKALKSRMLQHCGATSSGNCGECACVERGCCGVTP